jgi:hypothetical protein
MCRLPSRRRGWRESTPGGLYEPATAQRAAVSVVSSGRHVTRRRNSWRVAALLALAVTGAAVALGWSSLGALITPPPEVVGTVSPLEVPSSWRAVRDSRGHQVHVVYGAVPCGGCHDHDRFTTPPPEVCARCHTMETPLHDRPRPLVISPSPGCLDCHSFRVDVSASRACMRCHQRAQGIATAAVGIHAPRAEAPVPIDMAIESSIGESIGESITTSRRAIASPECGDCHHAHSRPTLDSRPCASCHRDIAEVRHGGQLGGTCTDCHSVHERDHSASDRCSTCHSRPVIGKRAVAAVNPGLALFVGHDTCTGCHRPHRFDRSGVAACRDCHKTISVLAESGRGASGHRCASCHNQHDPGSVRACSSCHFGASHHRSGSGSASAASACDGCHPIHTAISSPISSPISSGPSVRLPPLPPVNSSAVRAIAVACDTCHPAVKSHAPSASCTTCHPPHGAPPVLGAALCTTCHVELSRSSAGTGHATCVACHIQPGHQASRTPPPCQSCHQPVSAAVIAGHQDCTSCHLGANHAPRRPRVASSSAASPRAGSACNSCHAEQATSAPIGHRDCLVCHRPHDGGLLPSSQRCTGCHVDRVRGHGAPRSIAMSTALSGRQGLALIRPQALQCASCHRAHGPAGVAKPPPCSTCHDVMALPGLHQRTVQHRDCATCHAAHETTARSDRTTCLLCHQDRRDHEPSSALCATCHPFSQ